LIAKADGDDAIAEINEANNTYGSFITIGADLVVASLMMPDGGAGQPLVITDTTKNLGAGTAGASTTTTISQPTTTSSMRPTRRSAAARCRRWPRVHPTPDP